MRLTTTVFAGLITLISSAVSGQELISITDIQILRVDGTPEVPRMLNNRGDEGLAIDGDIGTASYLTPSGTTAPHLFALDLSVAAEINRLRIAKDANVAGVGVGTVDNMDLQILYSTDVGALVDRTYQPVSGLTSGYLGAELINAVGIDSTNATVDNDNHDFVNDGGFYSLSFDDISATALAVRFAKDEGTNPFNHYRLFEAELLQGDAPRTITDIDVFSDVIPAGPGQQPNNRGDQGLAIDGDETTASFLTPSFTETPHLASLDFGALHRIGHLRVKKDGDIDQAGPDSGAPGIEPVDNMDLQILYTTDTGPLSERTYQPVGNLVSGIGGMELINADGVNSVDATVDNEHHDFSADGWFALSFDAVDATGLAVRFARDAGDTRPFTHYLVYEMQVLEPIPEPASGTLFFVWSVLAIAVSGRRRRTPRA